MAQNRLRFKNTALLEQALIHSSYRNEHPEVTTDNERLEFLGDSIIAMIVGEMLYQRQPELPEGDMTRLRAALVRADTLAKLAHECRLGDELLMARGEEASGGRMRVSLLCDAFEALVGALYVDSGLHAVRRWLLPRLHAQLEDIERRALDKDARSRLQEIIQERDGITPVYTVIGESGPEHAKRFTVEVRVGERVIATGSGHSKQAAAQDAARNAMQAIE
ncbi:MAG: ribonuclease III [Chloroflexota bacterium]|nr:ribonuclease III [Chloroflexota bacterium]